MVIVTVATDCIANAQIGPSYLLGGSNVLYTDYKTCGTLDRRYYAPYHHPDRFNCFCNQRTQRVGQTVRPQTHGHNSVKS